MNTKEKMFISPAKDTVFKFLFKDNKYRNWLEEIILDQTVIDLHDYTLIDAEENTGSKMKDYRLDLLFEKENELVIVEMNTVNSLSNLFKNYSYLFRIAGNRYDKKEKIYERRVTKMIIINSYTSNEAPGIPVLFFLLQDKNSNIKRDMIESYEIYLSKANKKEYNRIEKRLLLFGAKSFDSMRKITDDPEDLKVIEELERLSMDDYFRYMYNEKEVNERLMNSRYQEGINDGISQGTKEKSIEIAKNLFELGTVSLEDISKATGLVLEEIKKLQKDV